MSESQPNNTDPNKFEITFSSDDPRDIDLCVEGVGDATVRPMRLEGLRHLPVEILQHMPPKVLQQLPPEILRQLPPEVQRQIPPQPLAPPQPPAV